MNKGLFGFLTIFIALFVGALYYTDTIQGPFISALNKIKSSYRNSTEFIENSIDKYFFQARKIDELKNKLKQYEKNHLLMQQLASQMNDLVKENNSTLKTNPDAELVRTISYAKFGDTNRIWLETKELDKSKVYGLVYKEQVAGIVVCENSKSLGLLNKDIQSSYAVYIGEELAPGIAHGNNSKNLVVKFIPAWFKIKAGDEVISSGLDEIFFKGLRVGKVISVSKAQGYQTAIVEPYYEANDPSYFHMIRRVK
ncbi:rod shape-determining protein MreC [bacterium]|nr:rod shape-determining protein MreC [bacterium]MBU1990850.1 rod shape-determining protein MreC [bacterium]